MVHFDMEQYKYKALTLAILKDILLEDEFQRRDDIGVTLQAYLRDSYDDLKDLVIWAKKPGHPRQRAPGEGGLLGPGNDHRAAERLAQPGL
jgi:proline dehydrogenase